MLSKELIVKAVGRLACLSFFPSDKDARTEVMRLLSRMVSEREELDWLIQTMIDKVGRWHGPMELRGVFCTRYKPADGIEASCSVGEFSPEAIESRAALQSAEYRALPVPNLRLLVAGEDEA